MLVDKDKPKYQNMDLLFFQEQFKSEEDCYQWLLI